MPASRIWTASRYCMSWSFSRRVSRRILSDIHRVLRIFCCSENASFNPMRKRNKSSTGFCVLLSKQMHSQILCLISFLFFNHLPEPLAPWKAKGKQINQEINRIINKSLEERRGWNWAEHIMHRQEASKLSPDALQCLLFELYLASSITTYVILQLLIKACIQHPEAMREMQIELDTVVDE